MIREQWEKFECAVIPITAGAVQRAEMRKAFFAGADSLFFLILAMLEPGAEPTESDLAKMEVLHRELMEWRKGVAG